MNDARLARAEWAELAGLGGTAYEVPEETLTRRLSASRVFFVRSAAEAAADEREGQYIEWTGRSGALVLTPRYEADREAWMEAS